MDIEIIGKKNLSVRHYYTVHHLNHLKSSREGELSLHESTSYEKNMKYIAYKMHSQPSNKK